MRAAIIDDLAMCRKDIKECLIRYLEDHYAGELPVIEEFGSGTAFLDKFLPDAYDIIFIDQYMEEISGIETAKQIRQRDSLTALIFVTTSHDHAVESYGVRASGYLIKPLLYKDFEQAMSLAHVEKILQVRFISIDGNKLLLRDILWCDRDEHYVRIHMGIHGIIRYRIPFNGLEALLEPYPQFLSCYRGLIVNMDRVQRMEQMDFWMDTGERVPFRKRDRADIKDRFYRYMFQKEREGSLL